MQERGLLTGQVPDHYYEAVEGSPLDEPKEMTQEEAKEWIAAHASGEEVDPFDSCAYFHDCGFIQLLLAHGKIDQSTTKCPKTRISSCNRQIVASVSDDPDQRLVPKDLVPRFPLDRRETLDHSEVTIYMSKQTVGV